MALAGILAEQEALNSLDASGTPTNGLAYVSLHSASPSTTGANEFSGGGYARQACSWNAATSAQPSHKTNSSSLSFTTSGSVAATHAGGNTAVTAGTFKLGFVLGSSVQATTITFAPGSLDASIS